MKINEEIKNYLKSVEYALLPARLDLGRGEETMLIVKSTRDVIGAVKDNGAAVKVAWSALPTGAGPVVCMFMRAGDAEKGEIVGEVYFDPVSDDEQEMLNSIGAQERLMVGFFDEAMEIVWATEVQWGDLERLYAEQAADRGDELAEKAVVEGIALDFKRACELFREEMPLEKLVRLTEAPA